MLDDNEIAAFFRDGFYERNWAQDFSDSESKAIAEKSAKLLGATAGHILDWCGGWGRISRHLSAMGFKVTILDITEKYLSMAKAAFPKGAELTLICADCRNTPSTIQADHAICSFNTVGFFSDEEQTRAFRSLHAALRQKARVVLDCINQLYLVRHFLPRMETQRPDGRKFVRLNHFECLTSTLHTDFRVEDVTGRLVEGRRFEQRMYTPLELGDLLRAAGFVVQGMYGDLDRNELSLDLPQIVAVVSKE
jgi:hypothetical protein